MHDSESKLNTETEEATSTGAYTEVIGGSGLQQHLEDFTREEQQQLVRRIII